jgi:hypothetical protein
MQQKKKEIEVFLMPDGRRISYLSRKSIIRKKSIADNKQVPVKKKKNERKKIDKQIDIDILTVTTRSFRCSKYGHQGCSRYNVCSIVSL